MLRPLAAMVLLSLPLHAERIRVVVATAEPAFAATTASSLRAEVIRSLDGASRVERWGDGAVFAAEIEREQYEMLSRDPRVRAIERDEGGGAALAESVPLIGADEVATRGFDGSGVTIAIVDSGIDADHPAFGRRVVDEQCFCENLDRTGCCRFAETSASGPGSGRDDHGHGTHVAGIAASAGTGAPRGVAPGVRLVSVRVLDSSARFSSFTQIYRALEWIVTAHPEVRVVNMSLGSDALFGPDECSASAIAIGFQPLLEQLRQRGAIVVASTGNQGKTAQTALPACIAGVLSVGATYDAPGSYSYSSWCEAPNALADQVACFSNSSPNVDLLAPGTSILSTWRLGGTRSMDGTSMAAPHVAGVIAAMLQASGGRLDAAGIEQIVKQTGKPVVDSRNGLVIPRVDAAAAIAATPRPPVPGRRRAVRH